jgi:hypothetical protein
MGRPPGKIHDRPFQMRASEDFLKSVDKWRAKQPDKPSRAEAIRRLVELGLKGAHRTDAGSERVGGKSRPRS